MSSTPADPHRFVPLTNLEFHVLVALAEHDRHGYGIIKDIEERTEGQLSVRSGALYTAIQRLLEKTLIDNTELPTPGDVDQRRKYYRITPLGREVAALEGTRLAGMVEAARQRRLLPNPKATR